MKPTAIITARAATATGLQFMSKANLFLSAAWIGGAAFVTALVSGVLGLSDAITSTAALVCFAVGWVLVSTRNADEYTFGLWTAAASLAFTWLLLSMIVLPFAEGIHEGLTDGKYGSDMDLGHFIASAIAAFYVGFLWKSLRGDT